jgi:RTX calcium-binding nonapeptide repeat (4 copies)
MNLSRRLRTLVAAVVLLTLVVPARSSPASTTAENEREAGAVFAEDKIEFSPATIVSAHFLGSEPLLTVTTHPEASDESMMFVDWPLGSRSQAGQLNRSLDSGDSFRLIYDPTCAPRNRPTCQTGGGGDTESDVNPFTGTLFFADQEGVPGPEGSTPVHESVASSTDYGDTFPPTRQFAITNTSAGADREWLAMIDPAIASVGPQQIEAFMSYKNVETGGAYILGIDTNGTPVPQPVPQLAGSVIRTGPLHVDNSQGPGRGWIYFPLFAADPDTLACPCGFRVATAPATSYQDPTAWETNLVSEDEPTIFPWLDLDNEGNAYAVWTNDGVVYLSTSPMDNPRNDPGAGGRPGTYWTEKVRVSLPEVGSAIFGEVVAGDPGRLAITYDGTTQHIGESALAPLNTEWHTYAAVITNGLGESDPIVTTGRVSHRVIHTGPIHCRGGCPGEPPDEEADHSLLDYIDVRHDSDGRIVVAFTDNHSTFATPEGRDSYVKHLPFSHLARQTRGPGLLGNGDLPTLTTPLNRAGDIEGDATWPNRMDAENLPALDLKRTNVSLKKGDLVARVPLVDGTVEAMTRDLAAYNAEFQTTPAATRLQYVVRIMTADDIYHLSMETLEDGTTNFFGGLLDANDEMTNVAGDVIAAGYHRDDDMTITGKLADSTIELRVPASQFGLKNKSRLYNVTTFAMAGPDEEAEEFLNPMRTVDATPPVDAFLLSGCDVVGTGAADTLTGTDAAEGICGRGGNDVIRGGKGADFLLGGADDDIIRGGGGGDKLRGSTGGDFLNGGWGRDDVYGKRGPDSLYGGKRADSLFGGRGGDLLFGGWAPDLLFGGFGRDKLDGGLGADRLNGGEGRDVCHSDAARATSCQPPRR